MPACHAPTYRQMLARHSRGTAVDLVEAIDVLTVVAEPRKARAVRQHVLALSLSLSLGLLGGIACAFHLMSSHVKWQTAARLRACLAPDIIRYV